MTTTNDITKSNNARLRKNKTTGCWEWHGWIVTHDKRIGYTAAHKQQQVFSFTPGLNLMAIKQLLPTVDEAVLRGEVPQDFHRTDERIRREWLEIPVTERRDAANRRVRDTLNQVVQEYVEQLDEFVKGVQENPRYIIEWMAHPTVMLQEMARIAKDLLEASDEQLPATVQMRHNVLLQRLLRSQGSSTGAFDRAVAAAEIDAEKQLYAKLQGFLWMYRDDNVPTEQK